MLSTLDLRAFGRALGATLLLIVAVVLGSRELANFDGALVAYLFGTIFAVFGLVYRYSVWLERPPTRRYWSRGFRHLFSARFVVNAALFARAFVDDLVAQRFIFRRSARRGLAHVLIAWGCLSAFAITLPLTFGWIHFTLAAPGVYQAHLFGFAAFRFPLGSPQAFLLFHALNVSSVMVLAGAAFYLRRRITDAGQIATQTFEMDWMPLVLLVLVSVTGLGITWDYELLRGKAHAFMAITHAIAVVLFLVWLPFGKFFHVFQRAAQVGVVIYRAEGARGEQRVCPHTGEAFASALHVDDLKEVTREVGLDFRLTSGGSHLDLSPAGKRSALAKAHLAARRKGGALFG
jgi:hypothetical protein